MTTHHIAKPDIFFKAMVKVCHPSYRGRMFKISTKIPDRLDSYWSGGSKDDFVFYELSTGTIAQVNRNHPFYEADQPSKLKELPIGFVIVKHTMFQGKDLGITVYGNPEDISPLLPPSEELSVDEDAVLFFTRSYQSSYGGIKNFRYHEAHREMGITEKRWEKAKASLIGRKLLNKAGAITPSGRNAVGERFSYGA
jgi:hypothetical protein